ncbi:pyridoxal-dependent decarboxylase [Streptomyces sp. NPDC003011]
MSLDAAVAPQPASPGVPARRGVETDPRLYIGQRSSDPQRDVDQLLRWAAALRSEQPRVLGFPGSLDWDFSALGPLLSVFVNNVGDPDSADASAIHAKEHELAIVEFFAETARIDPAEVYGYVTAGGSEGNLRGLLLARDRLPHALVYASEAAHHSVRKAVSLLGMRLCLVPGREDGTMDPDELRLRVAASGFLRGKLHAPGGSRPGAIVLATVGNTMHGGYDDVQEVRDAAAAAGTVYVHADAALGGLIAAHAPSQPRWSFADGADSISVSGHKVLGLPTPAGVFLARRDLLSEPADREVPEYIRATDRTLGCSRSGLAVLLMWAALRRLGHDGMRERVRRCLAVAEYAAHQLEKVGAAPRRPKDSLTVSFTRPCPEVVERWHLACEGDRAHLIAVAHVDHAAVDALCADLARQT